MSVAGPFPKIERQALSSAGALVNQAFSRAAGASLVPGNSIRLLKDAEENYPAWLGAIRAAKQRIHLESYIFHEDDTGQMFADALIAKAGEGVRVRLIYDWLGGFGTASSAFWNLLRAGGVDVRCYNPARWDSPFGWLSRDHRKTLCVDGEIGFVSGLCVGRMWVGEPAKNIQPWRDTGVEVRGPSVNQLDQAFATVWAMIGEPIPENELASSEVIAPQGETALRVVGSIPATGGMFRVDQLIAAMAKKRLWLTDAYYAGMTSYVQALRSAAKDGVDVRLLVPNATDVPLLKLLSRAGYRTLLEAGVRVFEWNGTMLHAKTAVADGRWARVGSTNLNIASWFGNCEMDVVVESEPFAQSMEAMFLADLENATEIVLDARRKVRAPNQPRHQRLVLTRGGGSSGRAAAGVVRIANVVGAAFTNRRVIEPVEARITVGAGVLLVFLAVLFAFFPRVIAYPLVLLFIWIASALFYQGWKLHRAKAKREKTTDDT
ncbi:MAG: cardiolipin synthase [Verrucomicrobiales bacterium]|jgi:cardiolipin synthase